jgi:hypothetical protein
VAAGDVRDVNASAARAQLRGQAVEVVVDAEQAVETEQAVDQYDRVAGLCVAGLGQYGQRNQQGQAQQDGADQVSEHDEFLPTNE